MPVSPGFSSSNSQRDFLSGREFLRQLEESCMVPESRMRSTPSPLTRLIHLLQRNPVPVFLGIAGIYCAALLALWIPQEFADRELARTGALFLNFYGAVLSMGSWPWWSPNFQMGASMTEMHGHLIPLFFFAPFFLLLDPETALKTGSVVVIFLSACSMFWFSSVLTRSRWVGVICGLLYMSAPEVAWRFAFTQQIPIAFCFLFPPLVFLSLQQIVVRGSWSAAAGLAASLSGFLLSEASIALLFLPAMGFYFLWFLIRNPGSFRRAALLAAASGGACLLLAGLPLLPMANELQWTGILQKDMLANWQHSDSLKTALSWFDRMGFLLGQAPDAFSRDFGAFYLGALVCFGIGGALFLRTARGVLVTSRKAQWLCAFLWISLLLHWLSLGPKNVLQGHMEFLKSSPLLPDWSVLAAYGVLAIQFLLLVTLCRLSEFPKLLTWILLPVYFLVPGFRVLEIMPGFGNIHAPSLAWMIGVPFALAVAGGIAIGHLMRVYIPIRWRPIASACLLAFLVLDLFPYFSLFSTPGLPDKQAADYSALQEQLENSPQKGRVTFYSGRHFPMMTPFQSGRILTGGPGSRFHMLEWTRRMEEGSGTTPQTLLAFFQGFGISHLVFDRACPETPENHEKLLEEVLDTEWESDTFRLFTVPYYRGSAFVWDGFVTAEITAAQNPETLLRAFAAGALPVEIPHSPENSLGSIGSDGRLIWKDGAEARSSGIAGSVKPFEDRRKDYHRFQYQVHGKPGTWMVVGEAWHPHWTVTQNGISQRPTRVLGALPGVPLLDEENTIEFEYVAPWWYSAAMAGSGVSWLLLFVSWPFLPRPQKNFPLVAKATGKQASSGDMVRELVVVPTYCEADGIQLLLEGVLKTKPSLRILVVDDASPDGTADIVRSHPLFEDRVFLLSRSGPRGLGFAYRDGLAWADANGYDAAVLMDADLSHAPSDIPRLLFPLSTGMDLVVGSRYCRGGKVIDWPERRRLLSRLAGIYVQAITGLPLRDPTSGFKAIRLSALRDLDWKEIRTQGYGFQVELHHSLWRKGARIAEIPITFTERRSGQTKMSVSIALEAALRVPFLNGRKQ